MERVRRTIAFPGAYIWALGAALILVGAVIPAWWAYLRTRAPAPTELSVMAIGDGPLRPAMVILPEMPDGKRFAISERPVTYGELIRVVREIPIDVLCGIAHLTRDDSEKSVVCMSTPSEAAYYANLLTDEENQVRRLKSQTWLTPCYKSEDVTNVDLSCTGYRLPTVEEWNYVATLGSHALTTGSPQAQSAPVAGPDDKECLSGGWFIFGMCDALEIAVTAGRDGGPVAVKADGTDVAIFPYFPGRPAIFRIVRAISQTDAF
jgi:hypothetical protein